MTTLPLLILGSLSLLSLLLLNWLTWKGLKNYLQPKGKTASTALEQQLTEQAFAAPSSACCGWFLYGLPLQL